MHRLEKYGAELDKKNTFLEKVRHKTVGHPLPLTAVVMKNNWYQIRLSA